MPKPPTFYHPLRDFRQSRGLSQPAFGEKIGCSGKTILAIENGCLKISLNLALQIAIAFDCEPQEFLDEQTVSDFKHRLGPMVDLYERLSGVMGHLR